jgi:GDPmannose 4,6-dehydratase
MIKLGLAKNLKLGNLDARRDWCYAKDAVEAMWLIMQQVDADDYIIGSGELHSVRELVEHTFKYVGLSYQDYVTVDSAFYRPDENIQLVGSIDKIKNKVGWTPKYTFENLIEVMVEHDLKDLTENEL